MPSTGRTDVAVPGALIAALVVASWQPIGQLFDLVRGLEPVAGFRLVPALVVIPVLLLVYLRRQGRDARVAAAAAAEDARAAHERAGEMQRLTAFSQALARSLDRAAIRDAVATHLPGLAPERDLWVMVRTDDADGHRSWETLTSVGRSTAEYRERAACVAIGDATATIGGAADICFPMMTAGRPVGVLAVASQPPVSDHLRSVLAAAAALLAVSLQNADLFLEIRENSVRDPLTGCYRRAHALEVLATELRRARRSNLPVSVMMFDLDTFKEVNDTSGHLAGDAVLGALGTRMRSVLRGSDIKCRYGGDEFLVVLPDTPSDGARRVAESLRRDLEAHPIHWGREELKVTASFGVTTMSPGEVDVTSIVARADAALYQAKAGGRNCVRHSDECAALSRAQSVQAV